MKFVKNTLCVLSCWYAVVTYAEVPVVDAIDQGEVVLSSATSNAPEKQTSNLAPLLDQVNNLQTQVQKLQGQVEVQDHEIKQLKDQLQMQHLSAEQPHSNQLQAVGAQSQGIKTESSSTADEQKQYKEVYNLIRSRDYVRATTALQGFISKFPNGATVANAHYWLGEIYLLQGQPDPAISEFNVVINNYPSHPKIPDAVLKTGFAYYDKGDWEMAKGQLLKVQKQFPSSPTAQLASARLREMKQQGR